MRETVSRLLREGPLALAFVGVLALTMPLRAQISLPASTSRSGSVVDDAHAHALSGQSPSTHKNTGLVSADILRHPLSEKVRKMLRRALEAMNSGKHEEAVGRLQETLAKYPNSAPYVHSILGVEYVMTNKFADAVNSFEVAVESFPHDPTTHYNLGVSLACLGRYDRAAQEARRALELDPKIASAHELLAVLHEQ